MNLRKPLACLAACSAIAIGMSSASAQSATPAPSPTPVTGYVGKGTFTIQSTVGGIALTVSSAFAFEGRGQRARFDVLSLGVPGSDPIATAVATQLLAPGGFSLAFDRQALTYVIWSTAKHTYYTGSFKPNPNPSPNPKPSQTATPAVTNPFGDMFGVLKSLKDDKTLSASIALTGHSSLYGHQVSTLHYAFVQTPLVGNASTDLHGDIAIADDFDGLPLQFTASLMAKGVPPSALQFAVTQIDHTVPPDADFSPPSGYARATSITDVLGKPPSLGPHSAP